MRGRSRALIKRRDQRQYLHAGHLERIKAGCRNGKRIFRIGLGAVGIQTVFHRRRGQGDGLRLAVIVCGELFDGTGRIAGISDGNLGISYGAAVAADTTETSSWPVSVMSCANAVREEDGIENLA